MVLKNVNSAIEIWNTVKVLSQALKNMFYGGQFTKDMSAMCLLNRHHKDRH